MRPLKPFTFVTATMALFIASSAQAAYKIDIQQVGSNVVASGSGSINLDALTFTTFFTGAAQVDPSSALAFVGSGPYSVYTGFSGPSSFGSGAGAFADSYTGPTVYIWGSQNEISVADGYLSGTPVGLSTGTFNNSTIASLGLTPGTYIWSWGSGSSADTFTVHIGSAAVPEPSTWAMMLAGFAGAGVALRRRNRRPRGLVEV